MWIIFKSQFKQNLVTTLPLRNKLWSKSLFVKRSNRYLKPPTMFKMEFYEETLILRSTVSHRGRYTLLKSRHIVRFKCTLSTHRFRSTHKYNQIGRWRCQSHWLLYFLGLSLRGSLSIHLTTVIKLNTTSASIKTIQKKKLPFRVTNSIK